LDFIVPESRPIFFDLKEGDLLLSKAKEVLFAKD